MGRRSTFKRMFVRLVIAATTSVVCLGVLSGCTAPPADGTQNTDPKPTATVPAPNGGSVEETVAPVEPGAVQEVELGEPADLEGGVSISVSGIEALDVEAHTPGEIAGPAVALTISVENASADAVDLSTAMISVTGSGGSFGQATTSEPFSPFLGTVEPGTSASGVYVFRLPAEERGALEVRVEYVAGAPIVLFAGSVQP